MTRSSTGGSLDEVLAFLKMHSDVKAIDIVLSDLHSIGRGKMIRRHELCRRAVRDFRSLSG
jgi:glutamine synthetase